MFDKMTEKEARLYWKRTVDRTMSIKDVSDNESEPDQAKRLRRLEKSYVEWFEYYFPNYAKKKCAWFHKRLARMIIDNRSCRVLGEIYRSGGKSVHIDMGIPLYLYYVRRDLGFMLLVGETDVKGAKLLADVQAQIQFNPRLIADYGNRYQIGDWADGDFSTCDGARFMSIGFMQNPRGVREADKRPDYIVVDDVDNKRHVNNDRLMDGGVAFITEDVWGCFDADEDATNRFVYANNNFHKNSITNRLKIYFKQAEARQKQNGEKSDYSVLTVCAVKDLQSFEPEWPEKAGAEYWRKKYETMPHRSFMREYMHKHVEDGSVFKAEDLIWGKMLKLDRYDSICLYGDLSYKDNGDFKGMVMVGKTGRQFHIIHTYLRQGSRAKCATWLYDLFEDEHLVRVNVKYVIEGLFAMDQFVNDFDLEGDRRGYYIPVVACKDRKGDKFDRIESMAGHFERHNVILNEMERNLPDQVELVDQYLAFEKGSTAHDDGPDAVHGAFEQLFKMSRTDDVTKFRFESRDDVLERSKNRF